VIDEGSSDSTWTCSSCRQICWLDTHDGQHRIWAGALSDQSMFAWIVRKELSASVLPQHSPGVPMMLDHIIEGCKKTVDSSVPWAAYQKFVGRK
jgi:hypothetical protein